MDAFTAPTPSSGKSLLATLVTVKKAQQLFDTTESPFIRTVNLRAAVTAEIARQDLKAALMSIAAAGRDINANRLAAWLARPAAGP
jgi:hypothetical protein